MYVKHYLTNNLAILTNVWYTRFILYEGSRKRLNNEELQTLINKLVDNRENQALVTTLATQLKDEITQASTSFDTLTEQVGEYEGKVDELQNANMNLFLKVGNPVPTEKLNDPEPLKYEDLITQMEGSK